MRMQLLTAMLAVTAIPGLALGQDKTSTPMAPLSPYAQVSQPGSQTPPQTASQLSPQPASPDLVPHSGNILEKTPGCDTGAPCGRVDWTCSPPSCFWVRGEYLRWWIKDSPLPALITTGVPGVTALPGVLGQAGTSTLFGGSDVDDESRQGGRLTAGLWLNSCKTVGLEVSYFFLASRSIRFDDYSSGAAGSAIIARPFFDVLTGLENAQLVAFPGIASGEIHVVSSSQLQGAELNVFCIPCRTPCCDPCDDQTCRPGDASNRKTHGYTCCGRDCDYSVNLLGGFRYLQLDENLSISEISRVNPALAAGPPLFGGSTIAVTDQFNTHNYFYGPQVGVKAEFCCGRVFADVVGKVALGVTNEVIDIHGSTAITSPAGITTVTPAGFLALGSNSGQFSRGKFAVVPEVGANVGCQITRHVRALVGYTFLYWSSVVRPGDQIDPGLSGTQLPTDTRFNPQANGARPTVPFRTTDFWAQGIDLGLEFRY